ncbi:MAG: helix-turn-helix domain-containing protein [Clostridia bacterium]|nr:helix-turn-helix domain-containing protein [Clostridia bacterium]
MAIKQITPEARVIIQRRWHAGDNAKDIAEELGIPLTTIYAELRRGRTGKLSELGRPEYDPETARINYYKAMSRKGPRKTKTEGDSING